MKDLSGKVVLVTGGSRGIGRAIVVEAASRGATVVFCARTLGRATDATLTAAAEFVSRERLLAVAADVSKEDDVEALFDAAIDAFDQVDVVVSNAGINRDALLVHTDADRFDEVIAVNLTGAFLTCRRGVQEFLAQGDGGRLIAIGSLSQRGATSQAAYSASKGGLVGLMRTFAKEYGHKGITANIVVCGLIDTELSDGLPDKLRSTMVEHAALRRSGAPEEVARSVMWLASDGASAVNGASIHVSGGLVDVPR